MSADLIDRARAWLAEDPDPRTRAELAALLDRAEESEVRADLEDRFRGPLEFGTAGLRGALGAGPYRMNRAVVIRAAAGLAAYLLQRGLDGPVVIGYDARHDSDLFAQDTAAVMTGAGLTALILPRALPTPVLAFAVLDLTAAAGVMVTASHNPARDNGYKVYLGDGSQIVPPADAEIAACIAAIGPISQVPRANGAEVLGEGILQRYIDAVTASIGADRLGVRAGLRIAYTPLHGVGGATARTAFADAGFTDVEVVADQAAPDPDFPTVPFPNPEEPGALDRAIATAAAVRADLVVANDPDADRCAIAVPGPHGWRALRGDELGVLLADHLLRRGRRGVYARSIVSSNLLDRLAEGAGQPHQETLTGFKWIGRIPGLVFGYEEALGYCVDPAHVRDKDGLSAMLLACQIAAEAKADGRTLIDLLDDLARRHGLYATDQLAVRFSEPERIPATMDRLRDRPPDALGGLRVEGVEDLRAGSSGLPPTDGLRYRLAERARVIVRPSGTEPKLKCYLEVVLPVEDDPAGVDAARIAAAGRLDAIRADLRAAAGL